MQQGITWGSYSKLRTGNETVGACFKADYYLTICMNELRKLQNYCQYRTKNVVRFLLDTKQAWELTAGHRYSVILTRSTWFTVGSGDGKVEVKSLLCLCTTAWETMKDWRKTSNPCCHSPASHIINRAVLAYYNGPVILPLTWNFSASSSMKIWWNLWYF